jgi:cell division protein FtsB
MSKPLKFFQATIKPFKNIYVLVIIIFLVWMVFFDANSWLIHNELNKEIRDQESKIEFYTQEISKDQKEIEILKTDEGIEAFAREHYKMKKADETIFIIEAEDSLKLKE